MSINSYNLGCKLVKQSSWLSEAARGIGGGISNLAKDWMHNTRQAFTGDKGGSSEGTFGSNKLNGIGGGFHSLVGGLIPSSSRVDQGPRTGYVGRPNAGSMWGSQPTNLPPAVGKFPSQKPQGGGLGAGMPQNPFGKPVPPLAGLPMKS